MIPRPCLVCGTPGPGSRCPTCQPERTRQPDTRKRGTRHYTAEYRRRAKIIREQATHCWVCGGGPRENDPFQADHLVPGDATPGTVLLPAHRSCNVARENKRRASTPVGNL